MTPQFTEAVTEALHSALEYARECSHTELSDNHLLYAFFKEAHGYFPTLSRSLGLDPDKITKALFESLKHAAVFSGTKGLW